MRWLNIITLLLIILGGLNWLLVGVAEYDLVAEIFGGATTVGAKIVYILVGLSAVYQLMPWLRMMSGAQEAR